jgi:hypothetical protein
MQHSTRNLRGLAMAAACFLIPAALAGGFELDWWTVDSGGGQNSTGGGYSLSGTIGQPDAGVMSGGTYTLVGGFWGGIAAPGGFLPGDMNCDGVVSVGDIGPFVLALTNAAEYMAQYPNCDINLADIDNNGMISVGDIGPFVMLITG